jgi:hypothetical protein
VSDFVVALAASLLASPPGALVEVPVVVLVFVVVVVILIVTRTSPNFMVIAPFTVFVPVSVPVLDDVVASAGNGSGSGIGSGNS